MPIIGIAKRLEEIYSLVILILFHIDKNRKVSDYFNGLETKLTGFAITFHRNVRSKNAFGTQLTAIPSIGGKYG